MASTTLYCVECDQYTKWLPEGLPGGRNIRFFCENSNFTHKIRWSPFDGFVICESSLHLECYTCLIEPEIVLIKGNGFACNFCESLLQDIYEFDAIQDNMIGEMLEDFRIASNKGLPFAADIWNGSFPEDVKFLTERKERVNATCTIVRAGLPVSLSSYILTWVYSPSRPLKWIINEHHIKCGIRGVILVVFLRKNIPVEIFRHMISWMWPPKLARVY